eukprot:15334547-Ditylum_brightwellii.AAC.1
MKILIWLGILPRRSKKLFDDNHVPICASCMFGEAHRRLWRTKGNKGTACNANEMSPGDGTPTDQLVSGQPGYFRSLAAEETLESMRSYERIAAKHGVTVKQYH